MMSGRHPSSSLLHTEWSREADSGLLDEHYRAKGASTGRVYSETVTNKGKLRGEVMAICQK
jgi:hypothetical protein